MSKSQATRSETDSPRATYQDVLDAPQTRVAEVVDGALYIFHRPAFPHARASSVLGRYIGTPFDDGLGGPGGWWIIDEPQLHLGEDIVVLTSQDGVVNECRCFQTPLTPRWLRTGYAKCYPRRRAS